MDRRKKRLSRATMSIFLDSIGGSIDNVDVATFDSDGSDLKALVVGIEPVQDLHGYDNPWPSGGGKNKFDVGKMVNTAGITISNGTIIVSGNAQNSTKKLSELADLVVGETYTLTATTDGTENIVYLYGTGANITWTYGYSKTITQEMLDALVFFYGGNDTTSNITDFMIRLSSVSDATFAPYSNICPITGHSSVNVIVSPTLNPLDGTITNIPLGGTYYRGTLDVITGLLTINALELLIDGTNVYGFLSGAVMNIAPYGISPVSGVITSWLCDTFACNTGNFGYNATLYFVFIKNPAWTKIATTEAEFNSYCQNTPIKLVMPLVTPTTIQLTGQQIATFVGTNNVWCSSGQIIHLEY